MKRECGRCHQPVLRAECCWFCNGYLCVECWDTKGHCGHPEADAINAAARRMNSQQRSAMARALQAELPGPVDYDEN